MALFAGAKYPPQVIAQILFGCGLNRVQLPQLAGQFTRENCSQSLVAADATTPTAE